MVRRDVWWCAYEPPILTLHLSFWLVKSRFVPVYQVPHVWQLGWLSLLFFAEEFQHFVSSKSSVFLVQSDFSAKQLIFVDQNPICLWINSPFSTHYSRRGVQLPNLACTMDNMKDILRGACLAEWSFHHRSDLVGGIPTRWKIWKSVGIIIRNWMEQ